MSAWRAISIWSSKSISRFARNTLDCLKHIRQLKEKSIPVCFEKESINSMASKGEVMLTILASLAQQESQYLSQNVKLCLQYHYQQGEIQVNCKWFLGHANDKNKRLVRRPIEKVTVHEGKFTVEFKYGMTVNVDE